MGFAEYDRYDALGLAELVDKGEVTALELLEEAIARAERVNPRLNAIVIRMHDIARERVKAPLSGPFAGVPFLMKDLAAGYAGVPLQSGSRMYRGFLPEKHSTLTQRYLDAGLVVFGKTSSPELGLVPVTEPELYGPTHNPWRYGVTPGGSSGGSAAAVAAGIVPMAHGGDGGGSIRVPASCCGLFGLKPSRARLPVGPYEPTRLFGLSVEHVLTRTVRDSAAMLDATAGPEDLTMFFPPAAPEGGYLAALSEKPRRLRVAFTDEPFMPAPKHAEATRAVERAAELCRELGHEVVRARPALDGPTFAKAFFLHFAVGVASEMRMAEAHLRRPAGPADVEQATWLLALVGRSIDAGEFAVHRRKMLREAANVVRFFQDYDVLLTPTLGQPPLKHGALLPKGGGPEAALMDVVSTIGSPTLLKLPGVIDRAVGRAFHFAPYTMVFNVTGQPSASVPVHWTDDGLPMGAMVTAQDEQTVLSLSAQIEEAQPWFDRRAPNQP